jgi:hypothetical protein
LIWPWIAIACRRSVCPTRYGDNPRARSGRRRRPARGRPADTSRPIGCRWIGSVVRWDRCSCLSASRPIGRQTVDLATPNSSADSAGRPRRNSAARAGGDERPSGCAQVDSAINQDTRPARKMGRRGLVDLACWPFALAVNQDQRWQLRGLRSRSRHWPTGPRQRDW